METILIWASTGAGFWTLLVAGFIAFVATGIIIAAVEAGGQRNALAGVMFTIGLAAGVVIPHAATRMIAPAEILSSLDGCAKGMLLGDNRPGDAAGEPIRMRHVRDVVEECERLIEEGPKVLERAQIRAEQEAVLRGEKAVQTHKKDGRQ